MNEVEHAETHPERVDGRSLEMELEARPRSIATARHAVRRLMDASARIPEELAEDVLLLVSELVTNAVLHAGTPLRIWASAEAGRVVVAVSDDDPGHAPRQQDRGPTATSGRGLRLVDLLASCWGVEVLESSKVVWFEAGCRPDVLDLRSGSL